MRIHRRNTKRARCCAALTVLLAALVSPACFKYQAIQPSAVHPEEEVRVRITDAAAVRLAGHYGSITQRLDGQLTPLSEDSLMLAIWIGKSYVGTSFENARQRLSLGRQEVLEISRRQFSRTRTALVTTGVVGVLAIIANRVGFLENPNPPAGDGRGEPPDPNGIRIPIRRIH